MNKDAKQIITNLQPLFTRRRNVRYWLQITNDPYDQTFNCFFNQQPTGHRQQSTPIHVIHSQDLAVLQEVIQGIREQVHFTIVFTGFGQARWPNSGRLVQYKPHPME